MLLVILLVAFSTSLVLIAARREGAFARPEFYLLVSVYLYGTAGYVGFTYLDLKSALFLRAIYFDQYIITDAYACTMLALASIFVGGQLHKDSGPKIFPIEQPHLLIAGVGASLVAILMSFKFFVSVGLLGPGGVDHSVAIDSKSVGFFFPYFYLMVAAVSVVACSEGTKKYSWMLFLAFAAINLLSGSRRHVLAVLIAIIACKYLSGRKFSKQGFAVIGIISAAIGIIVGATRGAADIGQLDVERVLMVSTEFMRSNISLLFQLKFEPELLYGRTAIDAMLRLVPEFLLPVEKPVALATEFKEIFGYFAGYEDRFTGQGFSPVGEVILNFSLIGVAPSFFVFTVTLRWVTVNAKGSTGAMIIAVLCVAMFNVGRGGFQPFFGFAFYSVMFLTVIIFVGELIRKTADPKQYTVDKRA